MSHVFVRMFVGVVILAWPAVGLAQVGEPCAPVTSPHTNYRTQSTLLVQDNGTTAPTLWIGVEWKGVYRSTDGGLSWEKRDTGLRGYPRADNPSLPCIRELGRIVANPSDPSHLYLLRVDTPGRLDMMNSETAGVFETRDAGATWTQKTGYANAGGGKALAVIAGSPEPTVIIGSGNGHASWFADTSFYNTVGVLFRSTDGGASWTELDQRNGTPRIDDYMGATQLYTDASGQRIWSPVYVRSATGGPGIDAVQMGFVESSDFGTTWTRGTSRLPDSTARGGLDGHVAPTNFNHRILIATNTPPSPGAPSGQAAAWYTLDGTTYQKTSTYVYVARYSPHDPQGLTLLGYDPFAGAPSSPTQGVLGSVDGGATWTRLGALPPGVDNDGNGVRISNFAFHPTDPSTIYASGSAGHVWRSTDMGVTWTTLLSTASTILGGTGLVATSAPDSPGAVTGVHAGTEIRARWEPSLRGGVPTNWVVQSATNSTFTQDVTETTVPLTPQREVTLAVGAGGRVRYIRVFAENAIGRSAASLSQVFRPMEPRSVSLAGQRLTAAWTNVSPDVIVTVPAAGLSPSPSFWTVTSVAPWLTVTGSGGMGAGTFRVGLNTSFVPGITTFATTVRVAWPALGLEAELPVTLAVQETSGGGSAPFGQVDTPTQNAAGVQGAVGVTGWALDDIGVTGVQIFRTCLPWEDVPGGYCQTILTGTPQAARVVFVGDAAFLAGARPDVEAGFSTLPQAHRAGWGMLVLTPMLPDVTRSVAYGGQGALTLYAVATDVEGQKVLLGRSSDPASPELRTPTSILMDNDAIAKPFGTIDTPALGETISGVIPNFGWALTPDVNTTGGEPGDVLIPTNGFTMTVFIDGLPTAQVIYNQCRVPGQTPSTFCTDDVSNIFGNPTPQPSLQARTANATRYRNLDAGRAPIGAYVLDTATLSNGLHTIAWSVSDSLGRTEGIGSRFFTVLNSGGGDAADAAADAVEEATLRAAPAMARAPAWVLQRVPSGTHGVWARTGFDLTRGWDSVTPDDAARRVVEISEGGRVELWLGAAAGRGFLVANGTLRDLPPGATLRGAQFAWVPPVGYIGDYALVFLRGGERIEVTVRIR